MHRTMHHPCCPARGLLLVPARNTGKREFLLLAAALLPCSHALLLINSNYILLYLKSFHTELAIVRAYRWPGYARPSRILQLAGCAVLRCAQIHVPGHDL
jgi:hypothetical protein